MEKQHLTYFKIENFKRFDSFEMSNLGQFNLIVGDNNVGKTSVLEALTFDEDALKLLSSFWGAIAFRGTYVINGTKLTSDAVQQTRFWESIFKDFNAPIRVTADNMPYSIVIELRPNTALSVSEKEFVNNSVRASIPNNWLKVSYLNNNNLLPKFQLIPAYFEDGYPDIKQGLSDVYLPFMPANVSSQSDLLYLYYLLVNPDKKSRKELEANLSIFIPYLEEIRPHKISLYQEVVGVTLSNSNTIFPLTSFGDGTVKYFRFLLEILVAKNSRLMVDEIGSGIHFTRLASYWKSIIQLCFKYDVQLFATTHSLECQQAFIEALEDPEMLQYQKDARNISLIENKQGEVKAVTYNFGQFEYALNIGFNTRGGAR